MEAGQVGQMRILQASGIFVTENRRVAPEDQRAMLNRSSCTLIELSP